MTLWTIAAIILGFVWGAPLILSVLALAYAMAAYRSAKRAEQAATTAQRQDTETFMTLSGWIEELRQQVRRCVRWPWK